MLLRPSNTLLLDEPTNHLDLDSKEVLLDALADYGGTLVFVSHDRYFVERLATKIVEVGDGKALLYPGTYSEYLWSKEHPSATVAVAPINTRPQRGNTHASPTSAAPPSASTQAYEDRRKDIVERRKRDKAVTSLRQRIDELETRIADREKRIKDLEQTMSAPGFYDDHTKAKPVLDQHQALMWEVGDLLNQWEMLQGEAQTLASLNL
jgi:ATP-binding cassette subfamily F protein 3